jgi:hypothetical protein
MADAFPPEYKGPFDHPGIRMVIKPLDFIVQHDTTTPMIWAGPCLFYTLQPDRE